MMNSKECPKVDLLFLVSPGNRRGKISFLHALFNRRHARADLYSFRSIPFPKITQALFKKSSNTFPQILYLYHLRIQVPNHRELRN